MVASVSVFLPSPWPEAVMIKALRVHTGGLVQGRSGTGSLFLGGSLTQSDSTT